MLQQPNLFRWLRSTPIRRIHILYVAASILFSSCSYKFAPSVEHSSVQTVSIPFISGDEAGELTSRIVYAIEKLPSIRYVPDGGRYTLLVRIIDEDEEKIGYRFQPHKHVAARGKIIPSEGRAQALVEVQLIESGTKKVLIGPGYILGTCEFEHQNNSLNNDINKFSLGQLTDIDTTQDVLFIPLYRNTAEKVALWLQDNLDLIDSQS